MYEIFCYVEMLLLKWWRWRWRGPPAKSKMLGGLGLVAIWFFLLHSPFFSALLLFVTSVWSCNLSVCVWGWGHWHAHRPLKAAFKCRRRVHWFSSLSIWPLDMPLKQIPAMHSNQFQLRLDFRFWFHRDKLAKRGRSLYGQSRLRLPLLLLLRWMPSYILADIDECQAHVRHTGPAPSWFGLSVDAAGHRMAKSEVKVRGERRSLAAAGWFTGGRGYSGFLLLR